MSQTNYRLGAVRFAQETGQSLTDFSDDSPCITQADPESQLKLVLWTEAYGFLAFVLLIINFNGDAFGCLHEILAYVGPIKYGGKFILSPEKAEQWRDLWDLIFLISSLLNNREKNVVGSLTPIPPLYLGYGPFNTLCAAHPQVTASL